MGDMLGCGKRIKEWRKSKNLKLREVIEIFKKGGHKISQGSLSDIENGNSDPSAKTIRGFYVCTDINMGWMLTGETEPGKRNTPMVKNATKIIVVSKHYKEILIRRE